MKGQSYRTGDRDFALHVVDPRIISGMTYGPLSPPEVKP